MSPERTTQADAWIEHPQTRQTHVDALLSKAGLSRTTLADAQLYTPRITTADAYLTIPTGSYRGRVTVAERDALPLLQPGDTITIIDDPDGLPKFQYWTGAAWVDRIIEVDLADPVVYPVLEQTKLTTGTTADFTPAAFDSTTIEDNLLIAVVFCINTFPTDDPYDTGAGMYIHSSTLGWELAQLHEGGDGWIVYKVAEGSDVGPRLILDSSREVVMQLYEVSNMDIENPVGGGGSWFNAASDEAVLYDSPDDFTDWPTAFAVGMVDSGLTANHQTPTNSYTHRSETDTAVRSISVIDRVFQREMFWGASVDMNVSSVDWIGQLTWFKGAAGTSPHTPPADKIYLYAERVSSPTATDRTALAFKDSYTQTFLDNPVKAYIERARKVQNSTTETVMMDWTANARDLFQGDLIRFVLSGYTVWVPSSGSLQFKVRVDCGGDFEDMTLTIPSQIYDSTAPSDGLFSLRGELLVVSIAPGGGLLLTGEASISAKMDADSATTPVGTLMPYGGLGEPDNWLQCDGAAVSRTDYERLFDVIGTAYGVGDGSTTFNLPDMKGRFPLGQASSGTGSTLGGTGGTIDHTHDAHGRAENTLGGGALGRLTGVGLGTDTDTHDPDNPPFQTFNYIIKANNETEVGTRTIRFNQDPGEEMPISADMDDAVVFSLRAKWQVANSANRVIVQHGEINRVRYQP